MEIVFATMPRSGSEFLIRLTQVILEGDNSSDVLSLTPGRYVEANGEKLDHYLKRRDEGDGISYFRERDLRYLKLESPGNDILAYQLSAHFPEARWMASLRSIDKIITSHHNIKSWGWSEHQVLKGYVCDLMCYEYLFSLNRLFVVNVDQPSAFNLSKMLEFLDCGPPGKRAIDFVEKWYVINPLKQQQKKAGEVIAEKRAPAALETLRDRHPWLNDIEKRYACLWESCI